MLEETTGSGRKGGELRDMICNVKFSYREGNYIYLDYHDEAGSWKWCKGNTKWGVVLHIYRAGR